MAAPREYPLIVGLIGTLLVSIGVIAHQRVELARAEQQLRFGGAQSVTISHERHGWGGGFERKMRCWLQGRVRRCSHSVTVHARDELGSNGVAAAGHGALAAIALGRLRRRKRELVAAFGVDEPSSAQGDGSYRQPEPPARRVLPEHERQAWRGRLAVGFGVWGLALVVAAVAGHGVAPLPMPLTLLGWSALTLPAALAFARWREGAWWGPWLMGLGAVALGLVRSFAAAAPAPLLIVVCALCAWADERRWRREGRWG